MAVCTTEQVLSPPFYPTSLPDHLLLLPSVLFPESNLVDRLPPSSSLFLLSSTEVRFEEQRERRKEGRSQTGQIGHTRRRTGRRTHPPSLTHFLLFRRPLFSLCCQTVCQTEKEKEGGRLGYRRCVLARPGEGGKEGEERETFFLKRFPEPCGGIDTSFVCIKTVQQSVVFLYRFRSEIRNNQATFVQYGESRTWLVAVYSV